MSKKRSIQGKNNHGSIARHPCRSYLKGTCRRTLCDYWRPPEGQCTEQKRAAKPGKSVCSRIIRLMNNKTKSQRKAVKKRRESDDKNAVAVVKVVPQLKKPWDQFKKYGSLSLRYVKQVSWKKRTIAWKNTK